MKVSNKNKIRLLAIGIFVSVMSFGMTINFKLSKVDSSFTLKMLQHMAWAQSEQDDTRVAKAPIIIENTTYPCAVVPGNCQ